MTKREAKRLVYGIAADTILHDIDNGSHWICMEDGSNEELRSQSDIDRIHEAIREVAAILDRKAGR